MIHMIEASYGDIARCVQRKLKRRVYCINSQGTLDWFRSSRGLERRAFIRALGGGARVSIEGLKRLILCRNILVEIQAHAVISLCKDQH